MNLRVASFNIRNGLAKDGRNAWPFRRLATTTVMRHLEADVIGLQEAYGFQARGLRRRLKVYGVTGDGRDENLKGERCSVFYRKDRLRLVDSSTRWFGAEPFRSGTKLPNATHPRIATLVDLELDGRAITVVSTHFDQRHDENRTASAKQLAGWLGDGPTIVVGDLNAGPRSDAYKTLIDAGLRSALPEDTVGTNHDYGRYDAPHRIDHILVSPHWTIGASSVLVEKPKGRYPSDHWPIVADLTLPD